MGRAYKNFWSLNTDEAVVTGILRDSTPKNIEVLMPINAQMKDTDLVLMNMNSNKTMKIQVKGSRAYEPSKAEVEKYGDGNAGWFFIKKDTIHKSTADYFIFLVYVLEDSKQKGRRMINPHTITIPTKRLIELCKKNKKSGKSDKYNFFLWVNPKEKTSFCYKDAFIDFTKFLDKKGLEEFNRALT